MIFAKVVSMALESSSWDMFILFRMTWSRRGGAIQSENYSEGAIDYGIRF